MLRKVLIALALLAGTAHAQNAVRQTGPVSAGDTVLWANDHVVSSAAQRLANTGLGGNPNTITDNLGAGLTFNSANTSGQYNSLTIGHDSNGNVLFTVDSFGGLANKTAYLRLNGTLYPFPFSAGGITGPVSTTSNDVACWNNTSGTLLKDCGFPARPIITTLAALQAASTANYDTVVRTGNLASGDMPAAVYFASGSPCALNSGNGDNGGQIKSVDNKCWLLAPASSYDPRWWGARTDGTDAVASILAASLWIGNNYPGSTLDCGGNGIRYTIGLNAQANTPLFPLTHSLHLKNCFFSAAPMTATTDIWSIAPTTADTDGWGFQNITVYSPLNTALWRDTWVLSDGGDNTKFIRGLNFEDILVYPSLNRAATGKDLNVQATDLGTGFLVQSTLGPNVALFEGFTCTHCGDSITVNGFTMATDGSVNINKKCLDTSLATSGAGEFAVNELNCTQYGGVVFNQMYGAKIRGGVFELGASHLASATGAFLTITGSIDVAVENTQFQACNACTPPGIVNVDAGSRNINIRPIVGANIGTAYTVAALAAPTTFTDSYNHHANVPYLQTHKTANQTGVASATATTVIFDTNDLDPALGYNNSTGHYTPTVADGAYFAVATVCFNGTFAGGGYQILITKNDATVVGTSPSTVPPTGTPTPCLTASGLIEMNGSTDFLDVRVSASLSAGTGTIIGSQTSGFAVWRLSP